MSDISDLRGKNILNVNAPAFSPVGANFPIIISPVCWLSPDYIVINGRSFIFYSIIFILSSMICEIDRNVNLDYTNLSFRDGSYEDTACNTMKMLRTNDPKKITMGYLNINSIDGIMDVVGKN